MQTTRKFTKGRLPIYCINRGRVGLTEHFVQTRRGSIRRLKFIGKIKKHLAPKYSSFFETANGLELTSVIKHINPLSTKKFTNFIPHAKPFFLFPGKKTKLLPYHYILSYFPASLLFLVLQNKADPPNRPFYFFLFYPPATSFLSIRNSNNKVAILNGALSFCLANLTSSA